MWVCKVKLTRPEEEDVRDTLVHAIKAADDGGETYTLPDIVDVEAEWTGH